MMTGNTRMDEPTRRRSTLASIRPQLLIPRELVIQHGRQRLIRLHIGERRARARVDVRREASGDGAYVADAT